MNKLNRLLSRQSFFFICAESKRKRCAFGQNRLGIAWLSTTRTSLDGKKSAKVNPSDCLRNIGIMAHIDAGKTTFTERALFYANELIAVGEVHDGDTVMDYLDQERERGITINSAAISFDWNDHRINLIDTPGHVDFTVEVERAVRALDGAVAIFDAVAGVQAQSETVWIQAARYGVPRIAFVNKMDREGANFEKAVKMIEDRFGVTGLVCQLPYFDDGGTFKGVYDLVNLKKLVWDQSKLNKTFEESPITPEEQAMNENYILKAREELADRLGSMDEEFADSLLMALDESEEEEGGEGDGSYLNGLPFKETLRKVTINQSETQGVVLLCGSALKNTGVQPMLDAIVDYLPNPTDLHREENVPVKDDGVLRALAFKVQNDPNRGPLVFTRVYSGVLKAKSQYTNTSLGKKERVQQLFRAFADDFQSIDSIQAGDIGIVTGMKMTRTGDTLSTKNTTIPLRRVEIPSPVFTASLELESTSDEQKLEQALEILTRDDPSLNVVLEEETGQILLSGMGELHLDIALSKLQRDFKIDCSFSRVRVALRETLENEVGAIGEFAPGGSGGGISEGGVQVSLRVKPRPEFLTEPAQITQFSSSSPQSKKAEMLFKDFAGSNAESTFKLKDDQRQAIENGILNGFQRGPILGFPINGVEIELVLEECIGNPSASAEVFQGAASIATRNLLAKQEELSAVLLEPKATVHISCPDRFVGTVLGDLNSSRRGIVQEVVSETQELISATDQARSTIVASVPLDCMIGYSTAIRSLTSGEASFNLTVDGFMQVRGPAVEDFKARY